MPREQPQNQRLTAEERQELVAYLDGEVPSEVAKKLESKIAISVSARREVDCLKQTWELLELLPKPEVTQDFTTRTVQFAKSEDLQKEKRAGNVFGALRNVAAVVGWLVVMVACAAVGFGVTRLVPDASRRLVADYPVIERFEEYRAVGNIKFLRQLRELRLLDRIDEVESLEPQTEARR